MSNANANEDKKEDTTILDYHPEQHGSLTVSCPDGVCFEDLEITWRKGNDIVTYTPEPVKKLMKAKG